MIDPKELNKDIKLYNALRDAMKCLLPFADGIKHVEGTNRVELSFRNSPDETDSPENAEKRAKVFADSLEAIRKEELRRISSHKFAEAYMNFFKKDTICRVIRDIE